MAMPMPGGRLQIAGTRESGADVRTQNVTAVTAIANIVKTSLGPVGLDKVRPAGGSRCGRRRQGRSAAARSGPFAQSAHRRRLLFRSPPFPPPRCSSTMSAT